MNKALPDRERDMLDRNIVAKSAEVVRENLVRRNASEEQLSDLQRLVSVINRRRQLQTETDGLRGDRKRISKEIGPLMKAGKREEAQPLRDQVTAIATQLNELEGYQVLVLLVARHQKIMVVEVVC